MIKSCNDTVEYNPEVSSEISAGLGQLSGVRETDLNPVRGIIIDQIDRGLSPQIITSVGGSEEPPSVVAPANIIPGLEVLKTFAASGDDRAVYTVRFASDYAVKCNNIDKDNAARNAWSVALMYSSFINRFYPDLSSRVRFESEPNGAVEYLPRELLDLVGFYGEGLSADVSAELSFSINKLVGYGKKRNPDVSWADSMRYLLSHITIFEDARAVDGTVDTKAENGFIIKVGAPSERQFSEFQSKLIEGAIAIGGLREQVILANRGATNDRDYAQVSLFGPRVGSRPPYYKQSDDEIVILSDPVDVIGCDSGLPVALTPGQRSRVMLTRAYAEQSRGDRELASRYRSFFALLQTAGIKINEYQEWFDQISGDLKGIWTNE